MVEDISGPESAYARPGVPVAGPLLGPPARRERADAARNRARVLGAAARLFAEHGVGAVTMDDIAAAAGVGKGTLYRRFTDKGELAAAVLDDLDTHYSGIKGRIVDEQGALRRFVNVYVGNDDVRFLENLETSTPEGTQISVIPAVAGG